MPRTCSACYESAVPVLPLLGLRRSTCAHCGAEWTLATGYRMLVLLMLIASSALLIAAAFDLGGARGLLYLLLEVVAVTSLIGFYGSLTHAD
ncbi:MAG: hypothetical protein AAF648_04885 [Pseudomonadota bacterium]